MARALGSVGTLRASSDGVTYTTVGMIMSISQPSTTTMVDVTDNDSGGAKSKLPGDTDTKGSYTAHYDPSDAGQAIIIGAGKNPIYLEYRSRGAGTGLPQEVGLCYLSKLQIDSKHEAGQELSFDVEYTGALTKTTQP